MVKVTVKNPSTADKSENTSWPETEWNIHSKSVTKLSSLLRPFFEAVVEKQTLDKEILQQFNTLYLPLANWVAQKHNNIPVIVGVNGAQGSGKTTLCNILDLLLTHGFDKSVVQLSLDDLYLSKIKRNQLAIDIHPLFKTRGVPGTHDVELGISILSKLKQNKQLDESVMMPVFDKAKDDVLDVKSGCKLDANIDIILFEGWCVGAEAQNESSLYPAINELEEIEDPQAIWRKYINQQLLGRYRALFELIDYQIMLKVPDMASVFEWRSLQEKKLALSCNDNSSSNIMSEKELRRFIMYFERITRESLGEMPATADIVLELNKEHLVSDVKINKSTK